MKRLRTILTSPADYAVYGDTENENRLLAIPMEENNNYIKVYNEFREGIPNEHVVKAYPLVTVNSDGHQDFVDIDKNNFVSFQMNKLKSMFIPIKH